MGVPQDTPTQRKSMLLLGYTIPLTHQLDGVNITGQIDKRFTARVFGTGLVAADAEGCNGRRTKGRQNGRDRPVRYGCPKKSADFDKEAEEFASGLVFGGLVEMQSVSVDRYGRTGPLFYFVMRYVKPDLTTRNAHLSSDHWRSTLLGWHNMR